MFLWDFKMSKILLILYHFKSFHTYSIFLVFSSIVSLIKRIISEATRKRRRRHRSVRPSQRAHGPESPFAIAGVAWALHVIVKLGKFSKSSHLTLKMFVKSLSVAYQYINLIQSILYRSFLLSKVLRRLQTTSFTHHDTTILSTTNLSFCVDYGRLLKKVKKWRLISNSVPRYHFPDKYLDCARNREKLWEICPINHYKPNKTRWND